MQCRAMVAMPWCHRSEQAQHTHAMLATQIQWKEIFNERRRKKRKETKKEKMIKKKYPQM